MTLSRGPPKKRLSGFQGRFQHFSEVENLLHLSGNEHWISSPLFSHYVVIITFKLAKRKQNIVHWIVPGTQNTFSVKGILTAYCRSSMLNT
jgi:hypothetical protein